MRFVRCATIGVAVAIGGTGAYAQSFISRTIDAEPVETTVVQGPNGTVITRRPVAPAVAPVAPAAPLAAEEDVRVGSATYMDETVGGAPSRGPRPVSFIRRVTRRAHSAAARRGPFTRCAMPPRSCSLRQSAG